MSIEAMKQALAAFEDILSAESRGFGMEYIKGYCVTMIRDLRPVVAAAYAEHQQMAEFFEEEAKDLRQAIEQAEKQEHDLNDVRCECCGYMTYHREHMGCIKAAYIQAEKQEPMPDDLILMYEKGWGDCETKLAEKQEPVAFLMDGELFTMDEYEVIAEQGDVAQPLYTAPPQREWQGLTDEEVSAAVDDCDVYFDDEFLVEFARRIEAKLKEKNHD